MKELKIMEEKKIRRWWILALWGTILSPIAHALFSLSWIPSLRNVMDSVSLEYIAARDGALILSCVETVIVTIIAYFCAYRKPGTRFLTFLIITSILYIPYSLYALGQEAFAIKILIKAEVSEKIVSFFRSGLFLGFTTLILCIGWLITSIQLRKQNKQKQMIELSLVPEYSQLFESIRTSEDLNTLEEAYGKSVRVHPEIAGHAKHIAKKRREELSSEAAKK